MENKRIAVFGNGWSNEFIEMVLEGIRKGASKDNVDIFVFLTYIYSSEPELQSRNKLSILDLPDPKDFDGAIMLTNTFNLPIEQEVIRDRFQRAGIPMLSTEVKVPGMAFLGTENYDGFRELADHIIEVHNVKNVVYVSGIAGNKECAIRKKALLDSLEAHGLKLQETLQGDFSFYTGLMLMNRWYDDKKPWPDAFVCANDHMAIGVSTALHQLGVEVPGEVIVTGFDQISEAKSSFPIMATVSRRWDRLGEFAYQELKNQMTTPDPTYEKKYPSVFVPSESCGCPADEEQIISRLEKVRNSYMMTTYANMLEQYFQNLRISMLRVENQKSFFESAKEDIGFNDFLGPDFHLCMEPEFFETEEEKYIKKDFGYSKQLDCVFEKRDGECIPPYRFDSRWIVPGYKKDPNTSNLYIVVPLTTRDCAVGYLVLKNSPEMVYDLSLGRWVNNMNTLLSTIKQYIFSKKVNDKLETIYMTDFLTGMYNRTGCENVLFKFIEDEKLKGHKTVLLFADIDYMKRINDNYGHTNGDLAIRATGEALKKALPEGFLAGRYGGDEFVAVGMCPENLALETKNRFAESMRKSIKKLKLGFDLSVSVGYRIISPGDDGIIEDYIKSADDSMYEEKEKAHKRINAEQA